MNKDAFKQQFKKPKGAAWPLYRRLLIYGRSHWLIFLVAVFASACYSGIDSLFVYLMKPLLDEGFINPNPQLVKWIPLLAVGLFFLRSVSGLAGDYFMGFVGRSVVLQFRKQIFDKLMHLPCSYYDKSSSGYLLSMISYNSAQVASACTDAVSNMVQAFCMVTGLIIVMFSISWKLSLTFFAVVPLVAISIRSSSKRLRRLNKDVQLTMAQVSHCAEEAIESYKVVRTFGGEEYETQRFNQVAEKNLKRELKIIITKGLSTSTVQLVGVCGLSLMIYLGTQQAMQDSLTAGGFAAVLGAMMALLKPLKEMTAVNSTIQRGLAGAESIFELIDEPSEKDTGTYVVDRVKGAIEINQLSFAYHSAKPVLQGITLNIQPGEIVAFVGRSGSGKSTLVSLLPRYYDCESGHIYVDGMDIFNYQLVSLRKQFALVSQHVTLFNDTIGNNIAYGLVEKNVTSDDIIRAAKAAHAMEFIEKLPQGLDTLIGENGVLLSGGQRQRIAIARAILKNAPILILDEATSALDTESERHIQAALVEVMRNRTTLVIAHRLSTIENADKIVVLDAGHIIEMGTHQALIAQNGFYAKLHRLQFKEPAEINTVVEFA